MTELHHNPDPAPDYTRFRKHLTRFEIDEILHHTHWIPNTKYPDPRPGEPAEWKKLNRTQRFFARCHPGWSLASCVKAFENAGILLDDGIGAPHGGHCHWQAKALHLNTPDDFAVEWDETVTEDDHAFHYNGSPDTEGRGSFSIPVAAVLDDNGTVDADTLTAEAFDQLRGFQ